MLQFKGLPPWRETLHRWTRMPLPVKEDRFPLFRGDPDAVPVLLQLATDQALDEDIRCYAIRGIAFPLDRLQGGLADDAKVVLQRCLGDAKREIRFAAAQVLLRFDEDVETSANVMLEIIRQQLKDASPNERIRATSRLSILGHCHKVELDTLLPILRQLQDDSDRRVRELAGRVLEIITEWRAKN